MIYYVTYIKDRIGNNYLGIKIPNSTVEPFLKDLKEIIGEADYNDFTENQIKRDNGSYHMTVINVMDYNKLAKDIGYDKFVNSLDSVLKYEIDDIKMMGIGTAERGGNRTYFIVCESDKLDAIRKRYELKEQDYNTITETKSEINTYKNIKKYFKNNEIPRYKIQNDTIEKI